MKRRIISLFLCFVLIFGTFTYNAPRANALVGVDDAIVFGIVAKLIISAGVSCLIFEQIVNWWDSFKADCPEVVTEISNNVADHNYAGDGFVYSPKENIYKYFHEVSDESWTATKAWVGEKYDVGENVVTEMHDSIVYYDRNTEYYIFQSGHVVNPSVEFDYINNLSVQKHVVVYIKSSAAGKVSIGYSEDGIEKQAGTFEFVYFTLNSSDYLQIMCYYGGSYSAWSFSNVVGEAFHFDSVETVVGTVTGAEAVCDNVGYDWDNADTGSRSVSVPLVKDDAGSLSIGNDTFAVDEETLVNQVTTYDYNDVIAESLDGVTVVDEAGIPTVDVVTDTKVGLLQGVKEAMDSLGDTLGDLGRSVKSLANSLALFVGDLSNLYLWVPSDTRALILTALGISIAAVIYKVVRG